MRKLNELVSVHSLLQSYTRGSLPPIRAFFFSLSRTSKRIRIESQGRGVY